MRTPIVSQPLVMYSGRSACRFITMVSAPGKNASAIFSARSSTQATVRSCSTLATMVGIGLLSGLPFAAFSRSSAAHPC